MASVATRRLIDAAAKLDPADRALLNLWVNRGLDDERLTGLTGMSPEALHGRREKIVARLAANLGLPETEVRGALTQISPDEAAGVPSATNGAAEVTDAPNGSAPTPAPTPAPPPAPTVVATAATSPPRRRRRGLWLGLAALAMLGAVAVAVIVIASSGGTSASPAHRAAARTTPAPTASTPAPTVPTPVHPTAAPRPVPLAGLPGGLVRASGSVKLSGPVKHLKLTLTVRGLPSAQAGHYEVWLYNSVLDSQPLVRLRNGHRHLTANLPHGARHYRWIDISFQPIGVVNHSGESVLRASNPAHTTMARLRKRSSRTRHRLRQATRVSVTHPASRHPAKPARRHASRGAHGGRRHRTRRAAHGSRKARTSK